MVCYKIIHLNNCSSNQNVTTLWAYMLQPFQNSYLIQLLIVNILDYYPLTCQKLKPTCTSWTGSGLLDYMLPQRKDHSMSLHHCVELHDIYFIHLQEYHKDWGNMFLWTVSTYHTQVLTWRQASTLLLDKSKRI